MARTYNHMRPKGAPRGFYPTYTKWCGRRCDYCNPRLRWSRTRERAQVNREIEVNMIWDNVSEQKFAPLPTNAFDAFWFLSNHMAGSFIDGLDIMVVHVNPVTERIEDDASLNTATRVWLETGLREETLLWSGYTHDPRLDCGHATFEEALVRLAAKVAQHYGYEVNN